MQVLKEKIGILCFDAFGQDYVSKHKQKLKMNQSEKGNLQAVYFY